MKLKDLISNLNETDDDLIIFQKGTLSFDSEILLLSSDEVPTENDNNASERNHYLIEVFLAKEFVDDWKRSLTKTPTDEETALRLFQYAINDA